MDKPDEEPISAAYCTTYPCNPGEYSYSRTTSGTNSKPRAYAVHHRNNEVDHYSENYGANDEDQGGQASEE